MEECHGRIDSRILGTEVYGAPWTPRPLSRAHDDDGRAIILVSFLAFKVRGWVQFPERSMILSSMTCNFPQGNIGPWKIFAF